MAHSQYRNLLLAWQGRLPNARFEGWPARGVAIEGDFAGIQNYVLKPVPGVRGAAKRLRGRSLLVSMLTRLICRTVSESFPGSRIVYSAGGRFLVVAPWTDDFESRLNFIRARIGDWAFGKFRGEVVFHLAAAEFDGPLLPRDKLHADMQARRWSPLSGSLIEAGKWREDRFYNQPGPAPLKCRACLNTASEGLVVDDDEEDEEQEEGGEKRICHECNGHRRLGGRVAGLRNPGVRQSDSGDIEFLGAHYELVDSDALALDVVHHLPTENGKPMTLEGVASHARGRRWLAYLRVDADRIGEAFMKKTGNDPVRVQALSRLLDGFFSHEVQELVSRDFRSIYPVYGGGDDLFVIGPWDQALAFSLRLEKLFATTTGGEITISAGVSLSRPKQHILSKSEEAEQALRDAKKTRRSIHALGETMTWNEFAEVLPQARQVADWHDQKLLPSAFVQDVLSLHNEWRKRKGDWPRYRPVLHYQIERNLGRSAEAVRNWADTLSSPQVWKHAGFIARYVMVASMSSGGEEID